MLKSLIFDYGGTLDTNARHWAYVLWEGFVRAAVPVSEVQFREAYVFAERTLAKSPIITPDDNFLDLLRKKVDIETRQLVDARCWHPSSEDVRLETVEFIAQYCYAYAKRHVTEARPLLEELKKSYSLVLVSNFYGNIHTILHDFKLDNLFESVIESAVVGVRKPNPAIYRLGVEATGCQPCEVMVIGDSFDKDVVPAKSIGCHAIWMKGEEWNPKPVDETFPDHIVSNLAEIYPYLLPAPDKHQDNKKK